MSRDIEILERLGEDVAIALGSGPSEEQRILQRRDFLATVTETRPSRVGWYVAAAAGIAVAVTVSLFLFKPESVTTQLPFYVGDAHVAGAEGQWIRTKTSGLPIRFEDGSRFALSANASARMVRADKESVRLDLASGKVRCNINRKTGATWQVAAGPYTITVTGTVFDAVWHASDAILDVKVTKGSVLVTGADLSEHGVRLAVGDRLRVDGERAVISQNDGEDESVENTEEDMDADLSLEAEQNAEDSSLSTPRRHQKTKDGAELNTMGLRDLWKAANKARYSRDASTAESMLTTLRRRFPSSREADASIFLMGRIRLELRSDPVGSVKWFKQYLKNTPNGPLAEEALGRIVDAYKRANETERAKRYAGKYLKRYSDGLFADLAKSVLSK